MGNPKKARKTGLGRSLTKKSGLKTKPKDDLPLTHAQVDREAVLTWLESHVPKARIQHIVRVETYAAELARNHGLDAAQAAQAGLLHDLAKYFAPQRLLENGPGRTITPSIQS